MNVPNGFDLFAFLHAHGTRPAPQTIGRLSLDSAPDDCELRTHGGAGALRRLSASAVRDFASAAETRLLAGESACPTRVARFSISTRASGLA